MRWAVTLSLENAGEHSRKRLTRFLCQELLYEYVTHRLDSRREKEINDFLPTCRESTRELDNLNKGLRYSQAAAQVRISAKLKEALENFEPHWKKRLRKWTLQSTQRGWKMLPYVFAALAVVLGVFATRPWVKSLNEDVMLAEQLKKEPDMVAPPKTATAPATSVAAGDEPAAAPLAPPALVPQIVKPPSVVVEPTAQQTPAPVATPKPATQPLPKPSPVAVNDANAEAEAAHNTADSEAMGRGFLYRAEIEVSDFHNSWPAIRDKVVALGGKVAGNVELGWLRKPSESYFHFSLPESNYQELELFLGTFSPVRFSKDRHPRVMPEGQIRIILTVKDGMTANEGSSETP